MAGFALFQHRYRGRNLLPFDKLQEGPNRPWKYRKSARHTVIYRSPRRGVTPRQWKTPGCSAIAKARGLCRYQTVKFEHAQQGPVPQKVPADFNSSQMAAVCGPISRICHPRFTSATNFDRRALALRQTRWRPQNVDGRGTLTSRR